MEIKKADTDQKVRSIVLLSGGLDSAANLALCKELDEPLLALTMNYGQKAYDSELKAAQSLSHYYGVRHRVVALPELAELSFSSLNRLDEEIPSLSRDLLDNLEQAQKTAASVWVPNRNGLFIEMAALFAEAMGAKRVIVGFNAEEAVTFADNSEDYLNALTKALSYSTRNAVEVFSYTVRMNKKEIVNTVKRLPVAFPKAMLWSCYRNGLEPCKKCESCERFERAWQ